MNNCSNNLRPHKGFTLIEIMIVVAIIGILTAIALPIYKEQVARSRRLDAQATLLEAAQFMERFYTQHGRYNQTSTNPPVAVALPVAFSASPSGSGGAGVHYSINLTNVGANTYTLVATRANAQAKDRCGDLGFNQSSVKTTTMGTVADCWRR